MAWRWFEKLKASKKLRSRKAEAKRRLVFEKSTLPCLVIITGVLLTAANPKDQQSQPKTGDPSTLSEQELNPVAERKRAAESIVAQPEKGGARQDRLGPVKLIECVDATDADLRSFAALDGLESLSVAGTNVTDAGLAALVKTHTLRHLWIGSAIHVYEGRNPGDPQITNEGLKSVGQLVNLESLALCVPRITGAGMAHLDGLKHLKFLCLTRSEVGDDGMRSVGGHTTLQRLDLGRHVTRKGLDELVRLTSLDELKINRYLKDDDLIPIGQMTNLGSLRSGPALYVTDEGLRHIKTLTRLRSLDLTEARKVTDEGMAYVAQMTGLETLVLNQRIGDAGIAHLSTLTNLKDLDLTGSKISDSGLRKLTSLPQLRSLSLMDTRVTAAGVAQLREMKKLKQIGLDYTDISAKDVTRLKDSGIPADKTGGSYGGLIRRW